MQIWLKGSSGRVRIPVLPSSYNVTSSQNNSTAIVCNLGEISLIGKQKLKEVSFSSFFPRNDESYSDYNAPSPESLVKKIERLKKGGRVNITFTGTPINFDATIESFEWGENDGTGDIYYSLTLKEYKKVNVSSSILVKETPTEPVKSVTAETRPQPEMQGSKAYEVKKHDSLTSIARKETGSPNWRPIYEQNKAVIGGNPNIIYPGQILIIPGGK